MKVSLPNGRTFGLYFVVAAATFLIMAWMIRFVRQALLPPPINQARIEERKKYLQEVRAAAVEGLNEYGWVDQAKGVVRLPIEVAMELTVEEWKNPVVARSNLVARADALGAPPPPPPKAPEEPSPYE